MAASKKKLSLEQVLAKHSASMSDRARYRLEFEKLPHEEMGAHLQVGGSYRSLFEALTAEGWITMSYDTFRDYCVSHGLERTPISEIKARNKSERGRKRGPNKKTTSETKPKKGFSHNPKPEKDELYGDD